MNFDQQKALETAIAGHNLLIFGTAGTGKTFLLKKIKKRLTDIGKSVKICCSTGIACNNFQDASTVHSFLGLCDGRFEPETINSVYKENVAYSFVQRNLMETDCLIVDECSMISKRTFETINSVCSRRPSPIQLIWCGDFLKLPPVPNHLYMDLGQYCFEAQEFDKVFPHKIKLNQIFRTEEPALVKSINELFTGQLSDDTVNFILSLKRPLPPGKGDVKLFSNNNLVDDYNRSCLMKHPGEVHEFVSTDIGDRAALDRMIVSHNLWLKIGCPVMLLQNLSKKLVNGLRGTVTAINTDNLVVEFGNGCFKKIPKVKFTAQNANIAEREQFPLRLAYGLTIHKAQGMTLERVKIDCREIFKPGQLAVAMSRATSATGIQVINFHRRYVMKPSRVVTEFLDSPSLDILPDARDCCSRSLSTDNDDGDDNLPQHESISIDSSQVPNDNEIDLARQEMETQELWEPEEDFETVIEAIVTTEGHLDDLDIPDELMKDIEEHIVVKKVFTTSHKNMNEVVSRMDRLFLNIFVKKLLVKLKNFAKLLSDDNMPITSGIPEKVINEFQRQVHVYSTGTEYRLNCMLLFEQESITDEHYIICYKILECVKLFFLKQKVNLISSSSSKIPQRFITDSSKARIRYVAGYCISKLRKKYQARQKSMLFSKSPEGQNSYSNSKNIVHILSLLKEDEQFLKENTTDPESLIDVESRQQLSHGLTNVTDQLYQFFITLTNESLQVMGNENFIKYGKNLFTHCQKNICENKKLSELFINLVCSRNGEENLQEFDNENQSNQTQPVLLNSNVMKVFEEVVNIYLTILLAQFRKDVKSAYKIEKKNGSQKTD